jgi:iron complex outermembrane receptor protein
MDQLSGSAPVWRRATIMTTGLASAFLGVASAQDTDAVLEEVVITATKRETSLMLTPVAVSAFTQEQLTRDGIQDIRDLGALVPNMQVGFSPSDSGVQVTVRGITSNNFTELGDPTVGIHVDGIYSPRPQSGMALLHDVERVEVLRGPQGTLFGRNSTAGAINVVSARPQFDSFGGTVEVELGNYRHRLARGTLNLPVNDYVALRASYMIDKTDSYIDQEMELFDLAWDTDGDGSTTGPFDVTADGIPNTDQRRNRPVDASDAYGNSNRWAARLSARVRNDSSLDWLLSFEHYKDGGAGMISLKDCEKAEGTFFACDHPQWYARINVPGELDMSINSLRSELKYEFSESLVVEHRVGLSSERRYQAYDGDGGFFADPEHPAYGINRLCCGGGLLIRDPQAIIDAGFAPYALMPFEDLQLTTRWSEYKSLVSELQVKSQGEGPLSWVVGAFYLKEDNAVRFDVEIPWCCGSPRPLGQSFVQPNRDVESKALFGQFDFSLTEKTRITAGYRYTWDEKSDTGGSNHISIGYWVNPATWDPNNTFWHESWDLVGIVPGWSTSGQMYQANALTLDMGSLAENFPDRIPGTDNTYAAKWSKGTWKLGFDHEINEQWFLYGSVATGFKAGGFGDKVDTCECGNLTAFPYDPEENTTFELGVKARLMDGRLNFIGTAFHSQYDDMQRTLWAIVGKSVSSNRDIGTLLTNNIAESEITGIELEFDWLPWKDGRIFGWVTWLDAEITNLPGADDGWFCFERAYLGLSTCPAEDPSQIRGDNSFRRPVDFTGNKLPWSPEYSATVTVEHSWRLANGLRLSPYVSAHWQSEMFFSDNNFDEGPFHTGQKAFTSVNASMRLISESAQWGAELYVYNATDELIRSWSDGGPGYQRASFFPPRTYGLKIRKSF